VSTLPSPPHQTQRTASHRRGTCTCPTT
jgi:hypothetical protein